MITEIKNIYHLIDAVLTTTVYKFPGKKLKVIGVTGTDGKTTTSFYIYNILQAAGIKTGLITTVEAKIGNKTYDTGFHVTTPNSREINKLLTEMVKQNCEYAVVEVTSHSLAQHRVWGIPFTVGVVTNVTREHLDYHKTFENYQKAKAKLIKNADVAILNIDDASYNYMTQVAKNIVVSFGTDKTADITPENIKDINIKLPGHFNILNALAATAVAKSLDISAKHIKDGIENVTYIPGRMEVIQEEPIKIIVDFAHTPNGLENALSTVKKSSGKGKLISVFGSAGLRDAGKRPIMGSVADKYADIIILTAEDPRTEDVNEIIEQIASGISKKQLGKTYYSIVDRQEAIDFAITKLAKPGDTVLITGKGHEKSMCFGTTEVAWSDKEAVLKTLSL